jgi:cellulose synthase/poly-beta-1,6-N-acetylglucosamine synthase-like glycosyltransferase
MLSVVIPTTGRPMLLKAVASILSAHRGPDIEIIIAGAIGVPAVAADLAGLMKQHDNIVHLPLAFGKGDSSAKKNAGWRAARADIVAFIDDDVIVGGHWPEAVLEPFQDDTVGLMSGPGLVPADISLSGKLAGWALASRAAGYVADRYMAESATPQAVKWSRLIGCNMAYRRKVLEEIDGFDLKFWPGEEMIAAYIATVRKGYKLVFQPRALLFHYPRSSYFGFLRQMYGYGATRIRLIRAGTDIEPTTLIPMFLIAAVVGLLAGAFFLKIFLALFSGLAVIYLLFALWCAGLKWRDEKNRKAWLIFFIIPGMHFVYGLAEWVELFFPNRDLSQNRVKPNFNT